MRVSSVVRSAAVQVFDSSYHEATAQTTEVYDRLGRLYQVTEASGPSSSPNVTTTYTYNPNDKLTGVSTLSGLITQTRSYAYDARGFLTSETHPEKGAAGNGTVVYQTFDSNGNIVDGYDARGHAHRRIEGSADGPFDVAFSYDAAERLTSVTEADPTSITSPKARRTLKTFTYATSNNPAGCTDTSAGCDARNGKVLTALRHNRGFFGDVLVSESYVYKGLGGPASPPHTNGTGPATFPADPFRTSPPPDHPARPCPIP